MAFFQQGKLIKMLYVKEEEIQALIAKEEEVQVIISSVNKAINFLQFDNVKKVIVLDHTTKIPINNKYKSPQTLGMDRLAAVIGAKAKFPSEPCLVIDAGTCITYDFIDAQGNYIGGSISPGIDIRFKALHSFTAKLPLIDTHTALEKSNVDLIGEDTSSSIMSGVVNGVLAELTQLIVEYKSKHPNIKVLICGGDANYFESRIKQPIFAVPELVHWGLNSILQYNES